MYYRQEMMVALMLSGEIEEKRVDEGCILEGELIGIVMHWMEETKERYERVKSRMSN